MKISNNDRISIVDVKDFEELASRALDIFAESAKNAVDEKNVFRVAISGGKTPRRFYELLGATADSSNLPWDKTELFWVDERCVAPQSKDSNYKLANETFLKKIPISPKNIHRIMGETKDYNQAVEDYDRTLRKTFNLSPGQFPQFDLMVLGMGPDGHIGSLLPNSYALFDTVDLVTVVYQLEGGLNRITLTHPVICAAKQLLVMVSGAEKASIVRDVLLGKPDEVKYPVHTLWPILEKVVWVIDSDAAKLL
ncbi:MAG: 6-phosphogluconolactonase [Sedimentisphaerales bacterium]